MNQNILQIKSIRYGSVHIDPQTGEQTNCGSKNQAKALSRRLGGAGKVIAARDAKHLKAVKGEYTLAVRTQEYKAADAKMNAARIALDAAVAALNQGTKETFDALQKKADAANFNYGYSMDQLTLAQEALTIAKESLK